MRSSLDPDKINPFNIKLISLKTSKVPIIQSYIKCLLGSQGTQECENIFLKYRVQALEVLEIEVKKGARLARGIFVQV
jgi:hypothetical protein